MRAKKTNNVFLQFFNFLDRSGLNSYRFLILITFLSAFIGMIITMIASPSTFTVTSETGNILTGVLIANISKIVNFFFEKNEIKNGVPSKGDTEIREV